MARQESEVVVVALDSPARLAALRRTALVAQADASLDRSARLVQRLLDVPVSLVSLVTDQEQVFPGQAGLPEPFATDRQTPLSHSFCQQVVTSARPLVVSDARTDPRLAGNLAIAELQVIAYAGFPLVDTTGEVLGSLCAIDHEPRVWTDEELATLQDLAAACSAELQLRVSEATARDALARLAVLSEVSQAVNTTLDADEALARLVRLVVPALGDWCAAGLVDDAGRVRRVASKHHDGDLSADLRHFAGLQHQALDDDAVVREVLRTGEALLLQQPAADRLLGHAHPVLQPTGPGRQQTGQPTAVPTGQQDGQQVAQLLVDRLDPAHVLAVPLRARTTVLGYLMLARRSGAPPYGEQELHDALDLARRAGLTLDNAALYWQQATNAEVLQRSLLTRLPEPDHLHVVARYTPAAHSSQVGGDWYDAFLQPSGTSVLVVGDVMGHDMNAAAQMGQLRNIVRALAYDRDEAPAAVLQRVDRTLRGLDVEILATAVVARIEQSPDDAARGLRRLRWSNAGHPPPVLLTADGAVRLLDGTEELLLGIDPAAVRTDHSVVLEPGSTVLLYTDGLIERRDSPLEHGLTRLRQALTGLAGVPLDELCDQLLSRMLPGRSDDDVALVAVRAHPEDRPRPAEAGPGHVPAQR